MGNCEALTKEDRSIHLRIRLTKCESNMLDYCTKENGLNKSEAVRKALKKLYDETVKNAKK